MVAVAARLNRAERLGDRILKVDHAGEHGAVNIYRAQIAMCRWRAPNLVRGLENNLHHEERHRTIFAQALSERAVRRCRSYHLCGFGGYALGLITGVMGHSAVAATTVAVEDVVLRHLHAQLDSLHNSDEAAWRTIHSIVEDEQAHRDGAANQLSADTIWPRVLKPLVGVTTEMVIWLGMHL